MKKGIFLLNKYTVAVLILLIYFVADVLSHKGMTRVLLPADFTNKIRPADFERCKNSLQTNGKLWIKAVNTVDRLKTLPNDVAGFEMDVYFDTAKNCLLLYHDSTNYSSLRIEAVLDEYQSRKMTASVWLDFKNLCEVNEQQSLVYISLLRDQYKLNQKMIIEASHPKLLQSYCNAGFFTSYYVPFSNPYQQNETEIIHSIDSIATMLEQYPVSALSGYYFQYPMLKKYFPSFPILTWRDNSSFSAVGFLFNRLLRKDEHVKVILHP